MLWGWGWCSAARCLEVLTKRATHSTRSMNQQPLIPSKWAKSRGEISYCERAKGDTNCSYHIDPRALWAPAVAASRFFRRARRVITFFANEPSKSKNPVAAAAATNQRSNDCCDKVHARQIDPRRWGKNTAKKDNLSHATRLAKWLKRRQISRDLHLCLSPKRCSPTTMGRCGVFLSVLIPIFFPAIGFERGKI